MSVQTGADLEKDVYGGLLTEVGQSNMPSGGSPANLNVEFLPGLSRTRGGLQVQSNYSGIAGGPWQVRYTKSYGQVPENQTEMSLLANPTLNTQGVIASNSTQIGSVYGYGSTLPWSPFAANPGWAGPLAKSSTQFGREYIAISEGRYGYDLPRQWDGTYYDRVSKTGPGLAPTAADSTVLQNVSASGLKQFSSAIVFIYEVGNLVTVLIADGPAASFITGTLDGGANAITEGDMFAISGTSSAFDGNWTCAGLIISGGFVIGYQYINPTSSIASATTGTFTSGFTAVQIPIPFPFLPVVGQSLIISASTTSGYNGTWPIRYVSQTIPGLVYVAVTTVGLSTTSSGKVTIPGAISMGLHQVSVSFIKRGGYITKPAAPNSWMAAGGLPANITNIPIGPADTIGRLLIFTPVLVPPAMTGTFYSIRENTSSYSSVMQINDNTTTSLIVSFFDSDLISGFNAQYLFGLIVLGECAGSFPYASRMFWWGELNSLQDPINMDFNGGWNLGGGTLGSDLPLGWTSDSINGGNAVRAQNGGVWLDAYQLNGGGPQSGEIFQSLYQNYLGNFYLNINTDYSLRITAKASTPAASTWTVNLRSASQGLLGTVQFTPGTSYSTEIIDWGSTLATIPADIEIQIYGSAPAGQTLTLDRIEIFPTKQPINYTVLRASYASDPESFDGVTGLIQPIYSNGEAVRTVYTLRDSLYIVCDRSTFVTKDVAGSEPAFWTVDPVSSTIGCTGPNAAAAGEDWEVKVNRYGLYMYLGREPEKISQEIQSLWNKSGSASQINWQYGYKIWATVDLQNKRVYIGAPINGAVECNCIFVMDYNTLDTSEMIAQYPTLRFSPYTGKRVILEQGRKWTQWTFQPPASLELPAGSNLPVPCGTFLEQSNGLATFVLGGGADSNVYFIDPMNRGNDNGQPCLSYYTTHFSPTQDEEQAAQAESGPMRGHMHLFSFLRKYVQGVGKMSIFRYTNTLATVGVDNPKLIGSIDLQNPAAIDAELTLDDAKGERFAISWQTNTLNSWWEAQRYIPVLECDPNNLVRGSNMQ